MIHEIIDNQSTEETTKQADEKDNKGSKSKWRQSLMERSICKSKETSCRRSKTTLRKTRGLHPGLAVVIVGEDPRFQNIRKKTKACMSGGWNSFRREYALPAETTRRRIIGFWYTD
ncbi:MAG: hypothetical protein ACLTE2_02275 [Eubacteriales bacterium]